jgi:hypothetical protein
VCISKANRERHLKDPSKRRARDRKNWASGTAYNGYYLRTYGITAADYERMLSEQGGVCFVCRGLNTKGRRLHVDHDHKTGAVRRLLCSGCNGALGHAKDDPAVLRKLADYLESFASEEVSPVQE